MSSFDFNGVSDSNGQVNSLYVTPGVQVLSIKEIEHVATPGATEYLYVTLESEKGGTFRQKFFLTAKALPRVQHLAKNFAGAEFEGNVTVEQMIAKLTGKSANVIVDGEIVTNNKGNNVTYPTLRYLGFAQPVGAIPAFNESMVKTTDKTSSPNTNPLQQMETVNIDLSQPEDDDLPF